MPRKPRKEPRPEMRRFWTFLNLSHLSRRAAATMSPPPPRPRRTVPLADDVRDWVRSEEDDFIQANRNKREQVERGTPREHIVLMFQRITCKEEEGALSPAQFDEWLVTPGSDGDGTSVADLLAKQWTKQWQIDAADLYVFYRNHRWTPADELRAKYGASAGVDATAALSQNCRAIAKDLREWCVPLSSCAPNHPMPDEMRRAILRASGSELQPGWLDGLSVWLNDAATLFAAQGSNLRRVKKVRFRCEWYDEVDRGGRLSGWRSTLLGPVGHRLFLLAFDLDGERYSEESFLRDTRKDLQARRQAGGGDAAEILDRG
jgi:hypothetical protein